MGHNFLKIYRDKCEKSMEEIKQAKPKIGQDGIQ
jgi:hypothetical protein